MGRNIHLGKKKTEPIEIRLYIGTDKFAGQKQEIVVVFVEDIYFLKWIENCDDFYSSLKWKENCK